MKNFIMDMYEGMVEFREAFIIAGEVVKEKLWIFYYGLGDKMMADGIRGKIWEVIFITIAALQFLICLPFIPVAFLIVDLPFDILRLIVLLNRWDED